MRPDPLPPQDDAGAIRVFDDVRASAKLAVLGGAFFLAGAVMLAAFLLNGFYDWVAWALGLVFLALGGGVLLLLLPRFLRRRTPFLVITEAGFRCPGLADPLVPWSAVAYATVSDNSVVCTDFFFEPHVMLPVRDRSRANVQLSTRRRQLSIRGPVPLGMDLEAYAARIAAAIEAGTVPGKHGTVL